MRDSERIFKVIIVTKNYGCAMSEVIGCQPVNLEAQVWSQASTGELCSRQSGSGTGSSTTTSVFPVFLPVRQFHLSVSFDQCSICIQLSTVNAVFLIITRKERKQKSNLNSYLTVHFSAQDKSYQELYLKIWILPQSKHTSSRFKNRSTKAV